DDPRHVDSQRRIIRCVVHIIDLHADEFRVALPKLERVVVNMMSCTRTDAVASRVAGWRVTLKRDGRPTMIRCRIFVKPMRNVADSLMILRSSCRRPNVLTLSCKPPQVPAPPRHGIRRD